MVPTAFGGRIYFFPIIYLLMFVICAAYGILVYRKLKPYDDMVKEEAEALERQKQLLSQLKA